MFSRAAQTWAVALMSVCLGATLTAQSPSGAAGPNSTPLGESNLRNKEGATSKTDTSTATSSGNSGSSGASSYGSTGSSSTTASASADQSLKRSDRRFITQAAESSQKEVAISQLAAQRASNPQVRSFAQQLVSEHQQMNSQLMQLAQTKGVALDMMPSTGSLSAGTSRNGATETSTNAGIATDNGAPRATGAAGTSGTGAQTGVATNSSTATSGSNQGMGSAATGSSSGGGSGSAMASSEASQDRHYRSLAKKTGAEFDKEYVQMMVESHEDNVKLFERAAQEAQDSQVRSFASQHLSSLQAHLDHANGLMKTANQAAQ